jgi:hypothetical protein
LNLKLRRRAGAQASLFAHLRIDIHTSPGFRSRWAMIGF